METIRQRNVRLTRGGLRSADGCRRPSGDSTSDFLHDRLLPDAYENIAPELLRIGATASVTSDVYACGCLLWQLLAGRPPFSMGDPLAMLAAHQTDCRRPYRPRYAAPLAKLIAAMTNRDIASRPQGFVAIASRLAQPPSHGSRRLKRFARDFESAAPVQRTSQTSSSTLRPTRLVVGGLLLAVCCGTIFHSGARSHLLQIAGDTWRQSPKPVTADSTETPHAGRPSPPKPIQTSTSPLMDKVDHHSAGETAGVDEVPSRSMMADASIDRSTRLTERDTRRTEEKAAGVEMFELPEAQEGLILLTHRGPFLASERTAVGSLTVKGASGVQPVIIVRDEPLKLWGTQVILDNVIVHRPPHTDSTTATFSSPNLAGTSSGQGALTKASAPAGKPQGAMVEILSESFGMIDSQVVDESIADPTSVRWQRLDPVSGKGGRIGWSRSTIRSQGAALDCRDRPETIHLQGVLKTGTGPLLVKNWSEPSDVSVTLKHCTLRGMRGLLQIVDSRFSAPSSSIRLFMEDSVIAPEAGFGLVTLVATTSHERPSELRRIMRSVSVSGQETYIQQQAPWAVMVAGFSSHADDGSTMRVPSLRDLGTEQAGEVTITPIELPHVEGLTLTMLSFRGPVEGLPSDSTLLLPPTSSPPGTVPGIDPAGFTDDGSTAYNASVPFAIERPQGLR
ncbi:MAG: hypothetical protein R3C01_17265 [Planctomycetaceae bacterium]